MSEEVPAQTLPSWVTGLCPVCGTWLSGETEEEADAYCRATAAYVIAQGVPGHEIVQRMNDRRARRGLDPLPQGWPEPINWKLAARVRPMSYSFEILDWIARTAREY